MVTNWSKLEVVYKTFEVSQSASRPQHIDPNARYEKLAISFETYVGWTNLAILSHMKNMLDQSCHIVTDNPSFEYLCSSHFSLKMLACTWI
jgi:hypothetical protein